MNKKLTELVLLANRVNRQHLQLIVLILSLALLVIGIGAPVDAGGPTKGRLLGGV